MNASEDSTHCWIHWTLRSLITFIHNTIINLLCRQKCVSILRAILAFKLNSHGLHRHGIQNTSDQRIIVMPRLPVALAGYRSQQAIHWLERATPRSTSYAGWFPNMIGAHPSGPEVSKHVAINLANPTHNWERAIVQSPRDSDLDHRSDYCSLSQFASPTRATLVGQRFGCRRDATPWGRFIRIARNPSLASPRHRAFNLISLLPTKAKIVQKYIGSSMILRQSNN